MDKCVFFVGPGSTGKTTLANELSKYTKTFMLTEVARRVMGKLEYNAWDISNDPEKCHILQTEILLAQYESEKSLFEKRQKFISDRSAIDPIVYADFFISKEASRSLLELKEWKECKRKYQDEDNNLIVLIEPNEKFLKDDKTRKMPSDLAEWYSFYERFIELMTSNKIPFKIIPSNVTSLAKRMDYVIEWIQNA